MIVLGLHGGVTLNQHEPSACLIVNGRVVALCEEERYTRIKTCYGYLPDRCITACLAQAGVKWGEIGLVVAPGSTYPGQIDRWRNYLRHLFGSHPQIELVHHQQAHLAAAFYGSGMESALCLSLDATGDGLAGIAALGTRKDGIRTIQEIPAINSLGFFYTAMTHYLGFNDGDEYKVMGLAPYGKPRIDLSQIIQPALGIWSFASASYLNNNPAPRSPFEPQYGDAIEQLLRHPHRQPWQPIDQFYKDVAASTQWVFERCLLNLVDNLRKRDPMVHNLCYAGGSALNCSANGMLLRRCGKVYIPPCPSDRGLALGCAYLGAKALGDDPWPCFDPYLGTSYTAAEIEAELKANHISYRTVDDPAQVAAEMIEDQKIIGWHQGRSEAGARALGNRSILASCNGLGIRDKVNARIKYREEFRPFAPSILQEELTNCYDSEWEADFPFMNFCLPTIDDAQTSLPAVVHVDNTSRVHTVRSSQNELYYDLINKYRTLSGQPAILNTSFNLRGQPIVESPRDAIMTFYGCGLDALFIGNYLVEKP